MATILKINIPESNGNDSGHWEYSDWGICGKNIVRSLVDRGNVQWCGQIAAFSNRWGFMTAMMLVRGLCIPGFAAFGKDRYYKMRYLPRRKEIRVFEISYKQFIHLNEEVKGYWV